MTETRMQIGEHGVWWGPAKGNLWAEEGALALPRAYDEETARAHVERYEAGEEYPCCACGQWFPRPWALQHFGGRWCEKCAEIYKARNATVCLLCRSPRWQCVC
jgi:hypothetical protein